MFIVRNTEARAYVGGERAAAWVSKYDAAQFPSVALAAAHITGFAGTVLAEELTERGGDIAMGYGRQISLFAIDPV